MLLDDAVGVELWPKEVDSIRNMPDISVDFEMYVGYDGDSVLSAKKSLIEELTTYAGTRQRCVRHPKRVFDVCILALCLKPYLIGLLVIAR